MKAMHKRLLVLVAAVLLLVSVMGVTAFAAQTEATDEPVCYEHGDVNGDGAVDNRDAIYLLFHSIPMFRDQYPLEQSGDFNNDNSEDNRDAIYLLFASIPMFKEQYKLNGTVHNYFDPIWTWDTTGETPTAQVSLKCACGQPHAITDGVSVTAGTVVDATCVAAGSKEYTAKVTYNGTEFENTVTVTVPAKGENGHSIVGEPTCEAGVKCQNCEYTLPKLDHSYVLLQTEKVEGCKHTKRYQCSACQEEIDGTAEGDVYYTHSYTAKIDTEATCTKAGLKLLTCSDCGDTAQEEIPVDPSFHVWGEGVKAGNVTTYTCACGQTKTAVQMDETNGVSADALKENEVELDGGATVALDEKTADQLDSNKTVVIKVTEVNKDETNLGADEKDQVGDSKIYDFTMLSGGEPVTDFEGEVTVALPYKLQDGDDVNAIDVWYIADDGSVECVKGVYNNGFVTFKTSHFSYYTVTRLTPAQRCAVYGHVNVTATKTATCTEDGYTKVYCQRCGAVESEDKADRLGHDYKKDTERSADATCDAPGKTVSVCEHCKGEKTEELKQLTHDWEKTETVAADCTSKGHDKHACKLCKSEKTDNEQEAKGHSWQLAENGWVWSEDYSKATVTLVCAHDSTHTKVLTAVVTKEMEDSVCVGGTVTYTATASYNKVTYTETATGTQAGVGHTPDTKWSTSDSQHYHLCAVCGEKVGAADHAWERTVTQAATCDKAGKATDKCSVCDLEKEVILPATGEHSFKNGVCASCGYAEGSCEHKRLHEVQIDLSEYGVCEGVVFLMSCDCGKITKFYGADMSCDVVNTNKSNEAADYYCWISTCKVCGLVAQNEEYRLIDQEACEATWILTYLFTRGDQTILDTKDSYYSYSHPVVVEHDPINLADYGLCGGTLTQETCPCGERSYWYYEGTGCSWAYDEANDRYICTACGAVNTYESKSGKEGCLWVEECTATYSLNGQEVFSYIERYAYEEHSYKTTSYELYGETCEDGVYIERTCSGCGKTNGSYYTYCLECVEKEVIDTTGAGFCSDSIVIQSCPCGANVDYSFRYADDAQQYHEWSTNSYDSSTGVRISTCVSCGYKRTIEPAYGDKDEHCCVDVRTQYTFTDDKGHSFAFATYGRETQHALEYIFVLKGDSCEDGLEITEACADCDYTYTQTTNWHYMYTMQTLDLSAYGYCGQTVNYYACPCGYNQALDADGECDWSWIGGGVLEGGGQFYVIQCTVCGIIWRQESVPGETDDPCKQVYHKTYSFLKDNETLGSIRFDYVEESHRYVYELKLNEGATTCTGGYSWTRTCVDCGETGSGSATGCYNRVVARQIIPAEGMCGELEKLTYRCACGREEYTDVEWVDESKFCSYTTDEWSDALGCWVYTCATCGSQRGNSGSGAPVEGTTCEYYQTITTTYWNKDGQVLATTEYGYTYSSHTWLYTYTLLGETCDDGWTCIVACADCGETSDLTDNTWYGCETNWVSREVMYENEAVCGPVYLYRQACACGAEEYYGVSYSCQGSWDDRYFTCSTCGLQQTNIWSYDHISGTCRESVTMKYTFLLNGETVATVEKSWEQAEHMWVYTFQLMGESCADGYIAYRNCVYCDSSETWGNYSSSGHSYWLTEYYEMPEDACGGYIDVYGCACGKERDVLTHKTQCSWRQTENKSETDENGVFHNWATQVCTECGMTWGWFDTITPGADACHEIWGETNTWKLGDWELSLSGESTTTDHDYETVSLTPRGDDCEEDGVTVLERCKVCGYEYTYTTHGHVKVAAESIDLAQYGSVCGGSLELYKCACGQYQSYRFSEDTLCDLDEKSTDHWIEGVLDANYYTTNYWWSVWSNSYLYTCAVTDPACAMQIRMADYWLNEGCTAVNYQTWQLGYDAETGTCMKEITVATGETRTYHSYVESAVNETVDGQSVSGYKYTCPDCGSWYTELSYYNDEGRQAKFVREGVNTLDNGENQKLTEIWERVYHNGYQYTSLQRDEVVHADGSTYWYQYAYTYDFTNGCYRTGVYTNSDGETSTYTGETVHHTSWSMEWIKEPTCTQFGAYVERYTCKVCGKVTQEYTYDAQPRAHSWQWDTEQETYVCYHCGLESANGASGEIVMEDLTANYTDGNYVIGYWNRGEGTFNPYVSLILYDAAEGEEDELVLTDIDFTYLTVADDGICGLRFSQEAVDTAAAAAIKEAGYTGNYAVRISFVPTTGTDTLDYAITFDTLTAE